MIGMLQRAGARFAAFFDDDPAIAVQVAERYDGVTLAASRQHILDDPKIALVVGTPPHDERAALGIDAMRHGKDYLCAKPGFTTHSQLEVAETVAAQSGRRYLAYFGERLQNRSTVKALELVQSGRIGRVVQTVGFGPHKLGQSARPDWFYRTDRYGGILNDLACHQIDQFLLFTGSPTAEIAAAHIGNVNMPDVPSFQDVGDVTLRAAGATGYIRVDWLTPTGLPTWGDVRLFVTGTGGMIELRKNIDLDGRDGTDHLLVVDAHGVERILCDDVDLPFGRQLIADILERTETAMTQTHCFEVCRLSLDAQAKALWIGAQE
ncbi:MAG: Gfo/Idh/MocA family oxidoreductase [Chloroflexi bacterium]|nr:Gfo/Idh/MocA family oxidoreductase [Chloroflexota bacterium]